jgi:hypothetical protein
LAGALLLRLFQHVGNSNDTLLLLIVHPSQINKAIVHASKWVYDASAACELSIEQHEQN